MNIDFVDRAPARVAYLRYTGPYGEPLGRFWRTVVSPWLADHGLLDCPRYGVPLDDPMTMPPERTRYNCCVQLSSGLTIPDATESIISGGRYAISRFKGTPADIDAAWSALVRERNSRHLKGDAARLPFEHYPRGAFFDHRTGAFACELCLPVTG